MVGGIVVVQQHVCQDHGVVRNVVTHDLGVSQGTMRNNAGRERTFPKDFIDGGIDKHESKRLREKLGSESFIDKLGF